jgi:hypothetical protein
MVYSFSSMEIQQIVSLLVSDRDRLNRAIEALRGGAKGRGRPRKNAPAAPVQNIGRPASLPRKRKRKPMTAAQRKAHSARMKAFWAARRKSAKS